MSNKTTFTGQHAAFTFVFCGLITLSCFPVLGLHYFNTLEGFAALAIGGLLLSDAVMWFAGFWSVKTHSGLMRSVSLIVKYVIASCAVIIAAVVIVLMRSDHTASNIVREQTVARTAEIAARAQAAKELASVTGGRAAAREFAKMDQAKSADAVVSEERRRLEETLPPWLTRYGIYVLLPIISIIGALALSISASIAGRQEEESAVTASATAAPVASNVIDFESRPRVQWRGGRIISGAAGEKK